MRHHRRLRAAIVLTAFALASGSCSDSPGTGSFGLLRPHPSSTAPAADSPESTLRLLEWCWNHLDTTSYRTLFTDDYRFVFGLLDPDGNAYRDTPWTREDELAALACWAKGGALSVEVTFDRNFRVTDDPRFADSGRWRKLIRTAASIRLIDASGAQMDASGFANFFFVRGDSALIPADLQALGVHPDSTRWYVDRWEDDTVGPGAHAAPVKNPTWGSVKLLCAAER